MKGNTAKVITLFVSLLLTASVLFGCGTVGVVITPNVNGEGETPVVIVPEQTNPGSSDEVVEDEDFVPDIVVKDEGSSDIFGDNFDDSIKYTYNSSTVIFRSVAGGFNTATGNGEFVDFTSTAAGSMSVSTSVSFPYGTISCDVKTVADTDSGIIFGLSDGGRNSYWEGGGISYYFFFLGRDGTAYLGKTDNGTWYVVKTIDYTFNYTDYYNLKVVYKGSAIYCFVNDDLVFACRESSPLTGTGFGVRAGASGVSFKNLTVTSDYVY